jgi:mono/diheme cytochrome c family protein
MFNTHSVIPGRASAGREGKGIQIRVLRLDSLPSPLRGSPGTTALFFTIAILLSTSAAIAQETPRGDVKSGQKLFVSLGCGACHGFEAQGSRDGPRLNPPPAFPVAELQIRTPRDVMPPFRAPILPDQGIADIYAFLQSLPKPVDVKAVRLLRED